jgi:hypothetical protein
MIFVAEEVKQALRCVGPETHVEDLFRIRSLGRAALQRPISVIERKACLPLRLLCRRFPDQRWRER